MNLTSKIAAITLVITIICTGCSNSISDPQDIVFPDTEVSYRKQVRPFMGLACAYSGCHSDDFPAAGVRLTTYSSFFESPGLIIPSKPDQSKLILIIEGTLPHPITFQDRITIVQKRGMRTWVAEGAKDN